MKKKRAFRIEKDIFGEVKIPLGRYWGTQTQRSLMKFRIGSEKFPKSVIRAFGLQKKSAALANASLGLLEKKIANAIIHAADEIIKGTFDADFPLVIWQTGSGTQTNMNCNEVIANRANEMLIKRLGTRFPVHPNDHVNLCQSSNDTFPTVMQITTCQEIETALIPSLKYFHKSLTKKAEQWKNVVKIGRTHLMDALPIPFRQEYDVYAEQIHHTLDRVDDTLKRLLVLPQGGGPVGTGFNADPHFSDHFVRHLRALSSLPFSSARIKNEGMACHDSLVEFSGVLNTLAVTLVKICNDVRFLSSGPRCGIAEYFLPVDGLTSSSMPGKVTATDAEAAIQACFEVMGNHLTVTVAGASGNFELNNFKPVILFNILQSITILSDSMRCFADNCLEKLTLNKDKIHKTITESLSLATALNKRIGYDNAGKIALEALKENISLKEAAVKLKLLTEKQFDQWVDPYAMAYPHRSKKKKK
jgi:fumarate hydratase, class II